MQSGIMQEAWQEESHSPAGEWWHTRGQAKGGIPAEGSGR